MAAALEGPSPLAQMLKVKNQATGVGEAASPPSARLLKGPAGLIGGGKKLSRPEDIKAALAAERKKRGFIFNIEAAHMLLENLKHPNYKISKKIID